MQNFFSLTSEAIIIKSCDSPVKCSIWPDLFLAYFTYVEYDFKICLIKNSTQSKHS